MKNVKIGACDWALPGNGLYAPAIANKVGLEALSLKIGLSANDYPLTQPEMQELYLNDQQKYGIEYIAIALNDFDNIPMHARENTKEYDVVWDLLKRSVSTAKNLGVSIIQIPGFAQSEVKTEEDMMYSAKAFNWLCKQAGEYGITVAGENLMTPDKFEQMMQMVDCPNFKLYFDSQNYHLFAGLNEIDILEGSYKNMCNQLHVKDGNGHMSGSLLGKGDSGFYDTIDWLKNKNYEGYILLENYYDVFPLNKEAENPYDLLRQDIEILKNAIK